MDLIDFNYNYLNYLLNKVAKEQKLFVSLLGDFKVNLLNYNDYNTTNEFWILLHQTLFYYTFSSKLE